MAHPFPLFESIWTPSHEIAVMPEVTEAMRNGAALAIGVSGGKDSAATAFATTDYLNEIGHQGPRLLIHSDLGRVEWRQSLSVCERLAEYLGLELIVVYLSYGYQLNGVLQFYSALPYNITSGVTTLQGTAGRPMVNGGQFQNFRASAHRGNV